MIPNSGTISVAYESKLFFQIGRYGCFSHSAPEVPIQQCTSTYTHKTLFFCPRKCAQLCQGDLKGNPSWNSRTLLCFKVGWPRGSRKHKEFTLCSSHFPPLSHICFILRLVACAALGFFFSGVNEALYYFLLYL